MAQTKIQRTQRCFGAQQQRLAAQDAIQTDAGIFSPCIRRMNRGSCVQWEQTAGRKPVKIGEPHTARMLSDQGICGIARQAE